LPSPSQASGLSLSGHAFSGVDIGGFSGDPEAELYLRWLQLATFLPLFRTHSAIGNKHREPQVYGEPTTSIIRTFLKLRYKLMPYTRTQRSGIRAKKVYQLYDQYL
jgi:alpha-glucosidase